MFRWKNWICAIRHTIVHFSSPLAIEIETISATETQLFKVMSLYLDALAFTNTVKCPALFHVPRIREWLWRHNRSNAEGKCNIKYGNCMACELSHIIKRYWNKYTQANDKAYMKSIHKAAAKLSARCAKG